MRILVTNDDGYENPGLHAVASALESLGDVTVVAPTTDYSGQGRVRSAEVEVESRDRGYAVTGSPVDCVIVGRSLIEGDPDIVVAGCNEGANLGAHTLGRSGTVSAAVEASFAGIPGLAVSLYVPNDAWPLSGSESAFGDAASATTYLVEHTHGTGVYRDGGYLNVNVPSDIGSESTMTLTHPSTTYQVTGTATETGVRITDQGWEGMADGSIPDPSTSDRATVLRGDISVSPLTVPHETRGNGTIERIVSEFEVPS